MWTHTGELCVVELPMHYKRDSPKGQGRGGGGGLTTAQLSHQTLASFSPVVNLSPVSCPLDLHHDLTLISWLLSPFLFPYSLFLLLPPPPPPPPPPPSPPPSHFLSLSLCILSLSLPVSSALALSLSLVCLSFSLCFSLFCLSIPHCPIPPHL